MFGFEKSQISISVIVPVRILVEVLNLNVVRVALLDGSDQ